MKKKGRERVAYSGLENTKELEIGDASGPCRNTSAIGPVRKDSPLYGM